jgi:hypothetical protein
LFAFVSGFFGCFNKVFSIAVFASVFPGFCYLVGLAILTILMGTRDEVPLKCPRRKINLNAKRPRKYKAATA